MLKRMVLCLICLSFLVACKTPTEESVVAFKEPQLIKKKVKKLKPGNNKPEHNVKSNEDTNEEFIEDNNEDNNQSKENNHKVNNKNGDLNIFNSNKEDLLDILKKPMGIVFDNKGNIFLIDQDKNALVKFSKDGSYIDSYGISGSDPGEFKET